MDVFGGAVGERLQQPRDLHGKPAFAEQQSLPADAPRHAGEKAALVLDGKKPSEVPVETMPELAITINTATADKLGIKISDDILNNATKVTGGVK